ncbi:hypothetical protein AB0C90_03335 [Streptomyces sp. NPDC048550]|uniref:hypothetical protein n=1 Tax=unclassified Streptomyces TaxID=2593676 RepID=UPI002E0EBAD5|nr:hypothetical protein OG299_04090 [Streptomyces sp. NBC_01296]WSW63808.1 hypothetical protein OG513_37525 [Streptomyces sp. NBC_00998]
MVLSSAVETWPVWGKVIAGLLLLGVIGRVTQFFFGTDVSRPTYLKRGDAYVPVRTRGSCAMQLVTLGLFLVGLVALGIWRP